MKKTNLNKMTIHLDTEYMYTVGWKTEEDKMKYKESISKIMDSLCFEKIETSEEKEIYFRGEELIAMHPRIIEAYVSEITFVEMQIVFEQNGLAFNDSRYETMNSFYFYNKQDFINLLEDNEKEIKESILEKLSEVPSSKEVVLETLELPFSYIDKYTKISKWYDEIKLEFFETYFNDLVDKGAIEEIEYENKMILYVRKQN